MTQAMKGQAQQAGAGIICHMTFDISHYFSFVISKPFRQRCRHEALNDK
jgi:hypothetical protein